MQHHIPAMRDTTIMSFTFLFVWDKGSLSVCCRSKHKPIQVSYVKSLLHLSDFSWSWYDLRISHKMSQYKIPWWSTWRFSICYVYTWMDDISTDTPKECNTLNNIGWCVSNVVLRWGLKHLSLHLQSSFCSMWVLSNVNLFFRSTYNFWI